MHEQRNCANCGSLFSGKRGQRFCGQRCYWDSRRELENETLSRRFWSRVVKSEYCWEWQGRRDANGYGVIGVGGGGKPTWSMERTHRVSWQLAFGAIPKGLVVRHKVCGNPCCVRPLHLALGTQVENSEDSRRHGTLAIGDRHPFHQRPALVKWGENHSQSKLTGAQVREIRARYATGGVTQQALATQMGVARTTIAAIISGRNWPTADRDRTADGVGIGQGVGGEPVPGDDIS